MHDIFHDGVHYFTHADKGFFSLIRDLIFRSGDVAREYVRGRRKKYFPPLNFYLVVVTIMVLAIQFLTPAPEFNVLREHPEIAQIADQVKREKLIGVYTRQHDAMSFMNKYSNTVAMVAVPLICLIYWLFYKKGEYNYAEHLIACLFMLGLANLLYTLIFIPVSALAGIKQSSIGAMWMVIGFLILQIVYHSIFYYRFVGQGTRRSAVKASLVSVVVIFSWFCVSTFLVGLYIMNGFWGLAG